MKKMIVFVVLLFIMPVYADTVSFSFNGIISSGPGLNGGIIGDIFYDPSKVTSTSDYGGSDRGFGIYTARDYFFSAGGVGVDFTGSLTDSFVNTDCNGCAFGLTLLDGSIQDRFVFYVYNFIGPNDANRVFKINIDTPDTTLVDLNLPLNPFVPAIVNPPGNSLYSSNVEAGVNSSFYINCLNGDCNNPPPRGNFTTGVPEPATLTLTGLGLLFGVLFARRKQ